MRGEGNLLAYIPFLRWQCCGVKTAPLIKRTKGLLGNDVISGVTNLENNKVAMW